MTKIKLKTFVISTLLTVTVAISITANAQIRGATSCGNWISERNTMSIGEAGYEGWIIGFLSGVSGTQHIDFTYIDNPSIFLWVDKYCRNNPLLTVADASIDLLKTIKNQKK